MLKKFTSALLAAAILGTSAISAYAQSVPLETAVVTQQQSASTSVWNGKTALEAGKKYAVTSDITISEKVVVPSGTVITVKDGAELRISSKGSLYIKGTVNVKANSTLAVSGKLYLYKGKKLTVYGTAKIGKAAVVTLNGKLTLKKSGIISGTGKTVKVGKNAVCTIGGTVSCDKLIAALSSENSSDDEAVKAVVQSMLDLSFAKMDYYESVRSTIPPAAAEVYANTVIVDDSGKTYTMKEMVDRTMAIIYMIFAMSDDELDMLNIVSCDISDFTVKYSKNFEIDDDVKKYYTNVENAAIVSYTYTLTDTDGTVSVPITDEAEMVKCDGKWYIYDDEMDFDYDDDDEDDDYLEIDGVLDDVFDYRIGEEIRV